MSILLGIGVVVVLGFLLIIHHKDSDEESDRPRVYCSDCKWFNYTGDESKVHLYQVSTVLQDIHAKCCSPNNHGFFGAWDSWYERVKPDDGLYPFERNVRNDCDWYQPIESVVCECYCDPGHCRVHNPEMYSEI